MNDTSELHPQVGAGRGEEASSLLKDSALPVHVVAQGIIANGPLLCLGAVMTSAAIYAKGALPLAYLLGAVVVWLWINTPFQYSKKLASAGGMFYFVSKGTSPLTGFLAGISFALYYTAFAAAGAVYLSVMIQSILMQFRLPSGPGWLWEVLPVVALLLAGGLVYRGIRPSLKYGLVAGLIELALMVVAAGAIVLLAGHANTLSVFRPSESGDGFTGVGIGLLLAAFGMSGSTATVYLGNEARLPQRSIRRGLIWSTSIVVVVFMLVSYAMTIGWGPGRMGAFANSNIPGLLVIQHYLGSPFELLVAVFMANSIVSAIVASSLVVSRVCYSMSDAGLLPPSLSKVDPTTGSPKVAVLACYATAIVGALVCSFVFGPVTAFTVLILVGTLGEFVGHILGNLGLPGFARRRAALRLGTHVLLPGLSLLTTGVGIYYTFFPVSFPTAWGPAILLAGLALATLHFGRLRQRANRAGRSASSETLADLIDRTGEDLDRGVLPPPHSPLDSAAVTAG